MFEQSFIMKNNRKEIQEELEKLAPSLSKLKKEESFVVPKDYFLEMQKQVMSQLDISDETISASNITTPQISWIDQLIEKLNVFFQPRLAVGFGMVLLLAVATFFIIDRSSGESSSIAEISVEEAEAYVLSNIQDFDDDELLDLVAEIEVEDISDLNITQDDIDEYMDEMIEEFSDDELEELL